MKHRTLAIIAALFLAVCVPRGLVQTPTKGLQQHVLSLAPVKMGHKWGYINIEGKMVIATQFDFARDFYEGLAAVEVGDKWGYIDRSGKMVIAPQNGFGYRFSDGRARAWVLAEKKWGFIDKTGKMVIAPQFAQAFEFVDGLAYVSDKSWKWAFIDPAGTAVTPFQFADEDRYASRFSEGVAAVGIGPVLDDRWGYIDRTGKFMIAARFNRALPFSENLARVVVGKQWGYVDHTGKMVIAMPSNYDYESLGYFHDGRALVDLDVHDGKTLKQVRGYIDTNGKMVIAPQFENVSDRDGDDADFSWDCYYVGNFSEGLAAVTLGDKWGYVDKDGRMVIATLFDDARDFAAGLAAVKLDKKWGFIDKSGKVIIAPQFDMQQCGFIN